MRRQRLVTLGNRCAAAAEAPVPWQKALRFGMSNEQVLCIIHPCSIFHAWEQDRRLRDSGIGIVKRLGARALAETRNMTAYQVTRQRMLHATC